MKCLGGLRVENELKLDRLHYRRSPGFSPFKNATNIVTRLAVALPRLGP